MIEWKLFQSGVHAAPVLLWGIYVFQFTNHWVKISHELMGKLMGELMGGHVV